jgi:protocatechuate 3,4-dioxygenase beta subunit
MRNKWTSVLCTGLVFVFPAVLAHAQDAESKEAKQVTCTGKVVDEQGQPIAGAKVSLYEMAYDAASSSYETKPGGQIETQADGTFSFSKGLETEGYRYGQIIVEKEGLALGPAGWDMRKDQELEIKLGQPKELAGIVVDENDKPIVDAEVSIPMLIAGTMRDQRVLSGPPAIEKFIARTDIAGKFKFTGIPSDATAEFFVKKPGRATISTFQRAVSADQKLKYAPGQTDIKLTLPVEAKIEGIVVEKSTGKPIDDVQMRCTSGQEIRYFGPRSLVSKQDGTFSIDALAPERYMLEVIQPREELPDWVAEPVEVITEAGKTQSGVKVELSKGGVLEVVVRDAVSKQPIEKASLNLLHETSGRYIGGSSGEDGMIRMRLLSGDYQVTYLYKQGYTQQRFQDTVTIEDGKTENLEYDLVSLPKIAGVVRNEKGEPLKGAKLVICPGGRDEVVSDAEGKFEATCDLGGWPSGETPVMFLVGRYEEGNLAAAVQMEEDARATDITLHPGVIFTGNVVDPNGKGIAGADVTIMLRGPRWGSSIGRDRKTSDAQGRFEIKAVPSGQKYSLYVIAEGYGENRSEEISADDAVNFHLDLGNVTLPVANLSVSGVVVDSDDKPVAGARLYCYGEGQSRSNTQTDADGKFTLEKVCAGKIRISADKSGVTRLSGYIETEGGATDVRIIISERPSATRYEPMRPPSLVGRPLPELKEVGIDLPPADTDGKMLLVCFFDTEQRPSRHCVTQLAKQAEQLNSKGVIIVAVQASKMDQDALNQWKNQYNISIPVGMVEGDAEKARFTWGVRSLPWLILTDGEHIIRAAGFRVNELNEKIGELTNVER